MIKEPTQKRSFLDKFRDSLPLEWLELLKEYTQENIKNDLGEEGNGGGIVEQAADGRI